MKNILYLLISTIVLSGCGKQIEDFVRDGVKKPIETLDPSISTASSKALKISPGAGIAKGAQVQGHFTITPTNQTAKGTQVEAKVSISQTRVE
ncbi:MAG: hypothetical protein ACXWC9_03695 [Pseudobdellovibrionaceae bacterium]